MTREDARRSEWRRSLSCMTDVIVTQELYVRTVDLSREVAPYAADATFCRFALYALYAPIAHLESVRMNAARLCQLV
jgi:hypothetical protein